ncbi:MAG TPA: hypothetical protein VNO52_00495 [Methylomirabilota bacterium]|nr:hypothetical protein [Methylomirabilota bacterium]
MAALLTMTSTALGLGMDVGAPSGTFRAFPPAGALVGLSHFLGEQMPQATIGEALSGQRLMLERQWLAHARRIRTFAEEMDFRTSVFTSFNAGSYVSLNGRPVVPVRVEAPPSATTMPGSGAQTDSECTKPGEPNLPHQIPEPGSTGFLMGMALLGLLCLTRNRLAA